jgi:hypothetical protein
MKRFIISEEEKKQILQKHANKGLTLSEKIHDLDETYSEDDDIAEQDEMYDTHEMYNSDDFNEMSEDAVEREFGEGMGDSLDQSTGKLVPYEREEEEDQEFEDSGLPENPKYEKSLEDSDGLYEEPMYEIEIEEDDEDAPFEKGPRGMRAARTRADFDPTSREIEMTGVFGKHGEDVPPTTIRYMRKNPGTIIKRMADMYGVDKIKNWLGED